jgi:hypothetical protein
MARGLLDYQADPVGQGLLSFGTALMTPRALGGGMAAGMQAFNQGAMQAQQLRNEQRRQAEADAMRRQQMDMQTKRFGMEEQRFGFERQQYEEQRTAQEAAMRRMMGVRQQIEQTKPELLPLFDANPQEAMKRLFPEQEKPQVVGPGASVVQNGKAVFTAPDRPPAPSDLGKLTAEMNALPPGDPRRAFYVDAIRKLITHPPGASMNVSYGAPFSGVGPDGKEMLYQPTNRGGPPMPTGLAPPPKAGGKPTEDENKSAGYAVRMEDALQTLRTVTAEDPGAATPPIFQSIVGNVSTAAANAMTPVNRQRIESAQLDALDAALTLATGAAYTKEQLASLSKSYFPQIGDKPQNIQEKQARLEKVIQTARIRAGTAAPNIDRVLGGPRAAPRSPQGMPTPGGPGAILRFDAQGNLVQ